MTRILGTFLVLSLLAGCLLKEDTQEAGAGEFKGVLWSHDGIAWQEQVIETSTWISSVVWADTQFVAVASLGSVYSSVDGVAWKERATLLSDLSDTHNRYELIGVTWSGSKFVAVGMAQLKEAGQYRMLITTSSDGRSWTERLVLARSDSGTLDGNIGPALLSVVWSGNQFVAVGSRRTILSSPDGINWTERQSGVMEILRDITWSGAQFVAVGGNTQSRVILSSPDGIIWTQRHREAGPTLTSVIWGGSQYVAVGDSGSALTSPDGIVWTERSLGTSNDYLSSIARCGSLYVATSYAYSHGSEGYIGKIFTSTDGIIWTLGHEWDRRLNDVACSDDRIVAVGLSG
jgi:hypothetical protein